MKTCFVTVLIAIAYTCAADASKGFPGIKPIEKSTHVQTNSPSMRMIKMRNIMTAWYCRDGMHSDTTPCIQLFGYDKTANRASSLTDFKAMYNEFCKNGPDDASRNVICSDALLKRTYGSQPANA